MRILIAYDGSKGADAALDDLKRAGLPAEAEALVLSIADVWLPPAPPDDEPQVPAIVPEAVRRARARAMQAVAQAQAMATVGCEKIQHAFPAWQVASEVYADSPAWAVVKQATQWEPDLVVVGSYGRSAAGRLIFGSVSQKVISELPCSVRVGRQWGHDRKAPTRVLIGVDGSPDAEAAVATVAGRHWPAGSEVRVVSVVDDKLLTTLVHRIHLLGEQPAAEDNDEQDWLAQVTRSAETTLRCAGLSVTALTLEGDPKTVLLEEAERWDADAIFLGAQGHSQIERFLLGSVSMAIAARAHCSVEIVRRKHAAPHAE
jgi:nucleotide-binding universal stress UspA family protein